MCEIAVAPHHADLVLVAETVVTPVARYGIVDYKVFAVQGVAFYNHIMADRIVIVLSKEIRFRVAAGGFNPVREEKDNGD